MFLPRKQATGSVTSRVADGRLKVTVEVAVGRSYPFRLSRKVLVRFDITKFDGSRTTHLSARPESQFELPTAEAARSTTSTVEETPFGVCTFSKFQVPPVFNLALRQIPTDLQTSNPEAWVPVLMCKNCPMQGAQDLLDPLGGSVFSPAPCIVHRAMVTPDSRFICWDEYSSTCPGCLTRTGFLVIRCAGIHSRDEANGTDWDQLSAHLKW